MRVVIFANGYGKKLRPLTLYRPKTMIELFDQPLLFHVLTKFIKLGLTDFVIFTLEYTEKHISQIKAFEKGDIHLQIINNNKKHKEIELLNGIKHLLPDKFIVAYADFLFTVEQQVFDSFTKHNCAVLIPSTYPLTSTPKITHNGLYLCSPINFLNKEYIIPGLTNGIYIKTISDFLDAKNTSVTENKYIGRDCVTEICVNITNSIVLPGTIVKSGSFINNSVIGYKCTLGRWVHINNSVLGDDVTVEEGVCINGAKILPNKTISTDILKPSIIV